MTDRGLDYIPGLIAAFRAGHATDHVHLGYWPDGQTLDWPQAQAAMTQLHLDALDLRDGLVVADIGCGIGGSIRVMNENLNSCAFTGVNIDPRQLAVCEEMSARGGNTLQWIEADAGATGIPAGGIDRVLSLEAMFHFPSRAAFFAEAARILRPGGRLVCSDILFAAPETEEEVTWLDLVRDGYAPWPDPVCHVSDRATAGLTAGLVEIESIDISKQTDPTWDHIVSAKEGPLSSPHAAMRALHRAGRMRYVVSVMESRVT